MKAAVTSISLIVMLALGGAGAQPAAAQPTPCPSFTPIVLGGQTNLAFVDINRNGLIDSNDCVVTGVGMQSYGGGTLEQGQLCFSATQGGPPFLPGCNGPYGGSAYLDSSSGMGMASEDFGDVEISYATSSSPSPSPNPAQSGKGGASGFPVPITSAAVFDEGGPVGEGFLCSDGGLAIRATVRGVNGIARFDPKSIGGVPYACSTLPFPTTTTGIQMFPLCVSMGTGGSIQGGLQSGPVFVEFPLRGLGACGADRAPTANEWGLLGLAALLLVLGTWTLRRRPAFGAALPSV